MKDKLLVIGLDPGTTVGYAVMDIEGNLVCIGSSKNTGMSMIIDKIIPLGSVLLVGTDKFKIPRFIEKFSSNNGAKVVSPRYDLSIDEKRNSIRNFDSSLLRRASNNHEVDALASAVLAYNSYSFLFKKIKRFAELNSVQDRENRMIREIVTNKISMKEALSRILRPEVSSVRESKSNIENNSVSEPNPLNPLNNLRRRIKYLENYNIFLKNKLIKKQESLSKLRLEKETIISAMDVTSSNKARKIIENTRYLIDNLISENKNIKNDILELKNENIHLKNLLKSKEYIPVIKIRSFGRISENVIDSIKSEEMLFVDDPSIISSATLQQINPSVIIYKKKPSSKIGCLYVRAEDLFYIEFQDFVLVKKKGLDSEINKKKTLIEIVDKYKNRFRG